MSIKQKSHELGRRDEEPVARDEEEEGQERSEDIPRLGPSNQGVCCLLEQRGSSPDVPPRTRGHYLQTLSHRTHGRTALRGLQGLRT